MRSTLRVIIVLFLLIASSYADWQPLDGHKMHYPQLPNETGWAVDATFPALITDDWQCSETGMIKDIHFWGAWSLGITGQILSFDVIIFSNLAAKEAPNTRCYSTPGDTLWHHVISDFIEVPVDSSSNQGWYDPTACVFNLDDHQLYFQYNIFLPESLWFYQEEGSVYWLSVRANVVDPVNTRWGWKSTLNPWNDVGVWLDDYGWTDMVFPVDQFRPGDVDNDCDVDTFDVNYLIEYLSNGGPAPPYTCPGSGQYGAADVNGSNTVNSTDVVYLSTYLQNCSPELLYPFDCPPGPLDSVELAFVVNGGPVSDIPTLGQWGVLILGLMLLTAGTVALIRRRRQGLRENA